MLRLIVMFTVRLCLCAHAVVNLRTPHHYIEFEEYSIDGGCIFAVAIATQLLANVRHVHALGQLITGVPT